jgi:hypothetical protein
VCSDQVLSSIPYVTELSGDQFHPDPRNTAILGVHSVYVHGVSICGEKNKGAYSLYIGNSDHIVQEDYILFHGQRQSNRSDKRVLGSTYRLVETCENFPNQYIRVLMSGGLAKKLDKTKGNQLYLGHFYVHYYRYVYDETGNANSALISDEQYEDRDEYDSDSTESMEGDEAVNDDTNPCSGHWEFCLRRSQRTEFDEGYQACRVLQNINAATYQQRNGV